MNPMIAMAGLAEAAFAEALLISWVVLGLISMLLVTTLIRRSWGFGLVAIVLTTLFGVFFTPWNWFLPPAEPNVLNDPDYIYWRARFQIIFLAWGLLIIAAGMAAGFVQPFFKMRAKQTVAVPRWVPTGTPKYRIVF